MSGQEGIAGVLEAHVRGDWSDRTYSCGGCRQRFEEQTQERWEAMTTDAERKAHRAELYRYIKPDWTLDEYHAHVAAAVTDWLTERLASEEVREAVVRAIYGDGLDGAPEIATAALTAVTEALTCGLRGLSTRRCEPFDRRQAHDGANERGGGAVGGGNSD